MHQSRDRELGNLDKASERHAARNHRIIVYYLARRKLLFEEATDINFFVGRAKNPAHQNSELPIGFDIKMGIVEKLSGYLGDMGKRVRVSYF